MRAVVGVLMLASCMQTTEPLPGVAGPPGDLVLEAEGYLVEGSSMSVRVSGGEAGRPVALIGGVRNFSAPECPSILAPTCLELGPYVLMTQSNLDATGTANLSFTVPANIPLSAVSLQAVAFRPGGGDTSPSQLVQVLEALADNDFDGLNNQLELSLQTDPLSSDSDLDGLTDGEEVVIYGTNPLEEDTDGGGETDGDEVADGTDPLDGADDAGPVAPPTDDELAGANDRTSIVFNDIDPTIPGHQYQWIAADTLDPAGDRDFYAVSLEAGRTYQFATLSYAILGQVIADTVLRLYDDTGAEVAVNDDMLFRYQESDSAIVYTARSTGTYYLEVLEFADYNLENGGTGVPLDGGPDFEYELVAAAFPITEVVPNATPASVSISHVPLTDPDPTADQYLSSFFASYAGDFHGVLETANDVDWWPLRVTVPGATSGFLTFSMWPDAGSSAEVKLSLHNSNGAKLAEATDPRPDGNGFWFDDVGVFTRVNTGEDYFVRVSRAAGAAGSTAAYTGMQFTYPAGLASPEVEPNDEFAEATLVPLLPSPQVLGLFEGGMWGDLPAGDDADIYRIDDGDVGGLDGKFLSIYMKADSVGSQLDPKISVYDPAGNLLAEANDDASGAADPNIFDLQLFPVTEVYIKVEAESRGASRVGQQFIVGFSVSPTPQHL